MEWAKDGIDGKLYIVQARPETVASQHSVTALETLRARRPRRDTGRRPLGRRADRLGCGEANREPHAPSGIQARPGAGRRHHHTGLGAGHEDGRGDRHQPRRSHLPRVDHRPRTRYPRGGGHRRRDHRVPDGAVVTVSCAEGDSGRVYNGAVGFHVDRTEVGDVARPRTQIMLNLGQPRPRLQDVVPAQRRRGTRPDGIHHQRVHQGPPAGPAAPREGRRPRGAPDDRSDHPGLPRRERLLRGAPLRGNRHHRRGLLAEARRGADVGLQDERVRQPARRTGLRAVREQPDDRLPRRLALRASRPTPRASRWSAARCGACATRWA